MEIVQWFVAATALLVAFVALLQWRTAQQKAVLDLFDGRHEIFLSVRSAVDLILRDTQHFDRQGEQDFAAAEVRAYFFFGGDVQEYLEHLNPTKPAVLVTPLFAFATNGARAFAIPGTGGTARRALLDRRRPQRRCRPGTAQTGPAQPRAIA